MTKKQTRKPSRKSASLSSWLDALAKIDSDLAPVPASTEGFFLDPDFRHLSVELPPQPLIDAALAETNGANREELTRRAERLERNFSAFCAARTKWREEVADPIRAKRGELGELADPVGKLLTFRRNVRDDVAFLAELCKQPNGRPIGYQGGMSQDDFAAACRVTSRTVKNWDAKKTTPPKVYHAQRREFITYSPEIRRDPTLARTFAMYYTLEREARRALKKV